MAARGKGSEGLGDVFAVVLLALGGAWSQLEEWEKWVKMGGGKLMGGGGGE